MLSTQLQPGLVKCYVQNYMRPYRDALLPNDRVEMITRTVGRSLSTHLLQPEANNMAIVNTSYREDTLTHVWAHVSNSKTNTSAREYKNKRGRPSEER